MAENLFYVTYNPGQEAEQNTALRLQTLASLYGLKIELPARLGLKNTLPSSETKQRLERANIVLAICLYSMSAELQAELNHAMQAGKTIVVLYQEKPVIDFGAYPNVHSFYLNYRHTDAVLQEIAEFLRAQIAQQSRPETSAQQQETEDGLGLFLGLLGIGLGLLAVWALAKKD